MEEKDKLKAQIENLEKEVKTLRNEVNQIKKPKVRQQLWYFDDSGWGNSSFGDFGSF